MKHEQSAPQVQQRGLYWENERMIHEVYEELRLLSERRIQAIKVFRAQEESLLNRRNELLAQRARYNENRKEDQPVSS